MADYNDIRARAQQVRDETQPDANSATRVGQLLMDLAVLARGMGNKSLFPEKRVGYLTRTQENGSYAVRSELDPEALCLNTICISEFAPTPEEKTTVVVWDPKGPLLVWKNGTFSGEKIRAKWVPLEQAAFAGIAPYQQDEATVRLGQQRTFDSRIFEALELLTVPIPTP